MRKMTYLGRAMVTVDYMAGIPHQVTMKLQVREMLTVAQATEDLMGATVVTVEVGIE
jgi:hypothetical protein